MGSRIPLLLAALVAAALLTTSALAVSDGTAVPGNPTRGKALFSRPGLFCASCHTLKAAKAKGRNGPNLDKAKPSYARIVERVTNGRKATRHWPTGMPGFAGAHPTLTKSQIQDLAAFVYTATHR